MPSRNEELLWLTLKNQYLLEPVSSVQQIVKDLVGIQAQYFNNALHAIKLRFDGKLNQLLLSEFVKTWTVRGTLHLICKNDLNMFISALKNEWFSRWGKYLENYFSPEERDHWQIEIYELIQSGTCDRNMMVSNLSQRSRKPELIKVALSSWGGILKDLAYMGKIIYFAVDRADFKICDVMIPIQEKSAKVALIERYLIGYSPASINDLSYWSQLKVSEVKKLFADVKLSLQIIQDDCRNEYYFIPRKQKLGTCSIPNFLFLAGFDPLFLGYKNKERFLNPEFNDLVFKKNGFIHSVLLHNGQVVGIWKRSEQTLDVYFFETVAESDKKLLKDEIHHFFLGEINNVNFSRF